MHPGARHCADSKLLRAPALREAYATALTAEPREAPTVAAARKRCAEIAEKESDEGGEEESEDEEIWDVDFIKDMRWKGGDVG